MLEAQLWFQINEAAAVRYPLPQIYWSESVFKEGDWDLLFMLVGKLSQQTSEFYLVRFSFI